MPNITTVGIVNAECEISYLLRSATTVLQQEVRWIQLRMWSWHTISIWFSAPGVQIEGFLLSLSKVPIFEKLWRNPIVLRSQLYSTWMRLWDHGDHARCWNKYSQKGNAPSASTTTCLPRYTVWDMSQKIYYETPSIHWKAILRGEWPSGPANSISLTCVKHGCVWSETGWVTFQMNDQNSSLSRPSEGTLN